MKVLHGDLRWVNEIYPFKNGIAKAFLKCVEISPWQDKLIGHLSSCA
jgi:hypothetical protein